MNQKNFTSSKYWFGYLLSKENQAAFIIQCFWREYKQRKKYLRYLKLKDYKIEVYISSFNIDIMQQTG